MREPAGINGIEWDAFSHPVTEWVPDEPANPTGGAYAYLDQVVNVGVFDGLVNDVCGNSQPEDTEAFATELGRALRLNICSPWRHVPGVDWEAVALRLFAKFKESRKAATAQAEAEAECGSMTRVQKIDPETGLPVWEPEEPTPPSQAEGKQEI